MTDQLFSRTKVTPGQPTPHAPLEAVIKRLVAARAGISIQAVTDDTPIVDPVSFLDDLVFHARQTVICSDASALTSFGAAKRFLVK